MYFCNFEKRKVMSDGAEYIIELNKLVKGSNEFKFEVGKPLFDRFGCEDILDVRVSVSVNAVKSDRFVEFHFAFTGKIDVVCSRCLSSVAIPFNKKTVLYIKFGDKFEEVSTEEWIVDESEHVLDFANYIYEECRIMIPIAPVHKSKADCDKTMLDKITSVNVDASINRDNEIDPRWEKLLELKS